MGLFGQFKADRPRRKPLPPQVGPRGRPLIAPLVFHNVERVGFRFVSLRQLHHAKYSLLARQGTKIPNKHGPLPANLCTAAPRRRPKIRSLRPIFSKPLDFADLVRI